MSRREFRTFLPSDPNAPEFIKKLYTMAPIDFDPSRLDLDKFNAFSRLVTELCHDFTVYSGMFGSEQSREMTYKLGVDVMLVVERALLTQICLRYAALVHDNSKTDRHGRIVKTEEVISFKELIKPLNSTWLGSKRLEMESFYNNSKLKKWRNKVIAHNDFEIFKDRNKNIPQLNTDAIREQLVILNDCINYLQNRQETHTEVEVQLIFGEGFDKYRSILGST